MDVYIDGRRYIPETISAPRWQSPGMILKKFRSAAGLSLEEAADRAGISKTYLWELEQNKANAPSLKVGAALADLYAIDLRSLARAYE